MTPPLGNQIGKHIAKFIMKRQHPARCLKVASRAHLANLKDKI
jgi:hypothetical protein